MSDIITWKQTPSLRRLNDRSRAAGSEPDHNLQRILFRRLLIIHYDNQGDVSNGGAGTKPLQLAESRR
jgi:hypothetical protein